MSLSDDVDLEELIMTKDDLSGADIKAVCSMYPYRCPLLTVAEIGANCPFLAEAGLRALRERRMRVTKADFTAAKEQVLYRKNENTVGLHSAFR